MSNLGKIFNSLLQKPYSLIFPILLLSFILRVFKLSLVPPGFWFDEASFSYSAYSVLKTGRDEFGQFLPLAFKSFGQYNSPLIFYWLVPFIYLGGLSIFSVRLASVVLGVLTTYGLYLLGKEIFKKNEIGLFSAFFFAVSPFSLQFNRMVHENNLLVCLLVFGALFLIQGLNEGKKLYLAALFLALTLYTYLAARIFIPLFIILSLIVFKKEVLRQKKQFIMAGLCFLVLIIPFLWFLTTPAAWPRTQQTSLLSDQGIILQINQERGEHNSGILARILHNKLTDFSRAFLENFLTHLNPNYLLFEGDPVKIYKTPGIGIMHLWEFLLFLLGAYLLLKKEYRTSGFFLMGWFLLALLPASLTRFVPSSSRSFQASPAISLICGFGFWFFLQVVSKLKFKKIVLIASSLFFLLNMIYYFDQYYYHLPKRYAYEWRDGAEETINYLKQIESNYQKIVVDQEGISYSNFLFFLKYPPQEIQKEAVLTEPDEFGFSYIPKFGKYNFVKQMPTNLEPDVLYVGRDGDYIKQGKIIKVVKNIKGGDGFFVVEK